MATPDLGLRLRSRLGPEACEELSDAFEEVQVDMLTLATDRFEASLRAEIAQFDSNLRVSITDGFAGLRRDINEVRVEVAGARVEVLRWAFLFWLGQFAATLALLAFILRTR
jgi:hypothetical protein